MPIDIFATERVLSAVGSICSIVALAMTVDILIRVRSIEHRFLRRWSAARLLGKLRENADNLARFVGQEVAGNLPYVAELSQCQSNLEAIAGHVGVPLSHKALKISKMIRNHHHEPTLFFRRRVPLEEVYKELISFNQDVDNWQSAEKLKRYVRGNLQQ